MGKFKEFDIRLDAAKQVVANLMLQYGHSVDRMDVVGSSYIVDRTDSDIDVLVLLNQRACMGLEQLVFDGWGYGGSVGVDADGKWMSWKKHTLEAGEVNILVTYDETYFHAWMTSAEVCRYLHLRGIVVPREERVAIHNIIMDDSTAEYETDPPVGRRA